MSLLGMLTVAKGGCVMTRKVSINWAPEDTADALHAQYRAEKVAEVRTRLHALWRLRLGEGPTAVAAGGGCEPEFRAAVAALVPGGRPGRGAGPSPGRGTAPPPT